MLLSVLLQDLFSIPAPADSKIARLVLDSRDIRKNDLFLAIKGSQQNGRDYIASAISLGASAVLVDTSNESHTLTWQDTIPIIPIPHLRDKVGQLAARFYDYPGKKLRIIGVTGTSGKTSCTHFIAQSLQALQIRSGIIGTLGSGLYGALGDAGLTTPDAITLQATLQQLAQQGAAALAMEVSSHSIQQEIVV